jgi:trehalose utilization protein
MKVLIFNEFMHEKLSESVSAIYPNGIHNTIADALKCDDISIKTVTLDDENCGITESVLNDTDVLIWWGHMGHDRVPNEVSRLVQQAVLKGMGFIALHSSHLSKPFTTLMGTSCTLKCSDNERERLWVTAPSHPIAQGLPEHFELAHEELYGEFFDVPTPDDIVFIGWFAGGEVFKSGCTFTRGYGKIFYFQPGHEDYPTYHDKNIIKVLQNAVRWAAPTTRISEMGCPCYESLEVKK